MTGPSATPAFVAADSQPRRLRALARLDRVGDVRLDDADRPAARPLDEARQEEQPERVRVREDTYAIADADMPTINAGRRP